jgi:hypothetical protein
MGGGNPTIPATVHLGAALDPDREWRTGGGSIINAGPFDG